MAASKVVGVLGGMGPEATVDFMAKVIARTPIEKEQDHLRLLVDQNPGVPSRQQALLGGGGDPGAVLAAMAAGLEAAGADFLVMPCNTAHAYAAEIRAAVGIPLVSIIDVVVDACRDFRTVALLSTKGCLESNLYQRAFAAKEIGVVLPDADEADEIMRLVDLVKKGDRGTAVSAAMRAVAVAMVERGAGAVVLACTEIPLVLDGSMLEQPVIASTDVLAEATVARARGDVPLPAAT